MNCKKCGKEIDKKAVVCPGCGCKIKKPIFKKWWFWVIVLIVVVAAMSSGGSNDATPVSNDVTQKQQSAEVVYEIVDLQTMFDDLDSNAMKAENNYKNKNIEVVCKISSFDSDGAYISVEPQNASEWNLITATCYIKNDSQKEILINKNVGDKITIKGKVKSIGEVLGYSIDIAEVL